MRDRTPIPSIAVAESREIARMLIETFDRTETERRDEGEAEHHDLVIPADGQLDCHELPIRTFDAIDALGDENGSLSFRELARAFTSLAPADRRRLIDNLRDPCDRVQAHQRSIAPFMWAGGTLGCAAGFVGGFVHAGAGAVVGVVAGVCLLMAAVHVFLKRRASHAIVTLLNQAL